MVPLLQTSTDSPTPKAKAPQNSTAVSYLQKSSTPSCSVWDHPSSTLPSPARHEVFWADSFSGHQRLSNPIPWPHQFSYRANRSIEDAITLHRPLSYLENRKIFVRMLFVNCSSVFNIIIPDIHQAEPLWPAPGLNISSATHTHKHTHTISPAFDSYSCCFTIYILFWHSVEHT